MPGRVIGILTFAALLFSGEAIAASIDSSDIHVIDGDTIRVHHKQPDVRLVGFNAPETRRAACEAEAEIRLQSHAAPSRTCPDERTRL